MPATSQTTRPTPTRSWRERRVLGVGLGSGLLGGLCCIGSAVAVGAGLGGLSFFSTWMDRYQTGFVLVSLAGMLGWLAWLLLGARRQGGVGRGLATAARGLGRQAIAMGVVYAVTLGVSMAAARLAGAM